MSALDRLTATVAAIVKHLTARFDYHAQYPCTVVRQNADGSLDLKPDDPRFGPGPSRVPIRLGLPGVTVTVNTPSRVLLGFENGDEKKPIATLWDASALASITITAASDVNINAGGNVAVTSTGSGKISLVSSNPGGIVLGDGGGNEAPIARVGDLVMISGGGLLTGNFLVNGPLGQFAPGAMITGNFIGMIQTGATIALAD